MRIAYLVNQYPKISHTFIRREILALEQLGAPIDRFSVRRVAEVLVDEADQKELARTHVLLDGGVGGLLFGLVIAALTRPLKLLRALGLTFALGRRSERGLLRHFAYLAEACLLQRALARTGSTHVHAHFGTNSAAVAMLCHTLGGPPFSFTVHGPEEFDKAGLIGLREKIAGAAFVVAISSFGRSQLYRYTRYSEWTKLHIVRCGLDASFLGGEIKPIPSQPRLCTVGRLSEQKGQALLIDAAAILAERGIDFELVLVGDGELRAEIDALIAQRNLGGKVQITGWADGARVRAELEAARVFVLPSFAEGLPVVLMEALAVARPVVATYVAGIPELVGSDCGWLVPAGSIEALADGMARALSSTDSELRHMGETGATRVRAQHDALTEAGVLLSLFRRYGKGAAS